MRTWSAEGPLWHYFYRTALPGSFNVEDAKAFNSVVGAYLIYGDHRYPEKLKEFANYMLERHNFFVAAKVSKFAKNGELIVVLLSTHSGQIDMLREYAPYWNLFVYKFKTKDDMRTDFDTQADQTWAKYIGSLASGLRVDNG